MGSAVRGYLFLTFLCIGSLFALVGLKQFFMQPLDNSTSNGIWFLLQVLPLLLLIPGLLRVGPGRGRLAFFFCAMAGMLYFIHGVWSAVTPELRTWALWETAFALGLTALGSLGTRASSQ